MAANKLASRLAIKTLALALTGVMLPVVSDASILFDTTFEAGSIETYPYSFVWPSNSGTAAHGVRVGGTIDTYNGTASRALVLDANFSAATGATWSAGVSTNQVEVSTNETHRSLLSVGFDLSASSALPVRAIVRSYDASGRLTGRSERVIYPPVANSFFRHVLDLSEFDPVPGFSAFNPASPRFELTVQIEGSSGNAASWPKTAGHQLRVDNISYTAPKYFVNSAAGNNDGPGTLTRPLKTINEALARAVPGDVIVVRGGTHTGAQRWQATADIKKAGSPSRWLTLRGYPGETATLRTQSEAWNSISLNYQAAYVEVRGLTLQGNAAGITLAQAEAAQFTASALHNANGISVDSRFSSGKTPAPFNQRAHHIRIVDNTVFDHSGGGILALESDYVSLIGNRVYRNSFWTRYATSGISVFHAWNFHKRADDYRVFVIGNVLTGNRCYIKWDAIGKISDGNGIIIDDFQNTQASSTIRNQLYAGRTLVQNNVSSYNGGSGMHAYLSDKVVFANNTAFLNAQSPELNYGQIFANNSRDVRIVNNIIYAREGGTIDGSGRAANLVNQYNQYYRAGGVGAAPAGTGNIWATGNWKNAFGGDFELKPESAARDSGTLSGIGIPRVDILGNPRPIGSGIDRGAFEYDPNR